MKFMLPLKDGPSNFEFGSISKIVIKNHKTLKLLVHLIIVKDLLTFLKFVFKDNFGFKFKIWSFEPLVLQNTFIYFIFL